MSELDQVTALLVNFGADEVQAKVMAAQLLKRSEQISEEKGVSKVEALAGLLELVKAGRSGESYERPDK
ncbi:hypothetical protein [Pelagicoccus mobilis]|uniref:Uncharacterized protein n=1 Tax=Pelagicoccus mobilis TaxID=415221 RepID=A0A934S0J7_9BACT|nr:hypothetical protein [Pelagicoccus mobilis]MBK1876888.1 hypothetical protein [Pelagicoccus mobilis]